MTTFLEDNLNSPLADTLNIMQTRILGETFYHGIKTYKNPLDLWIYQEIIFETKPDVILEIGNFQGGTTLALAHICDSNDHGRIIGVDISHKNIPIKVKLHPRITLIEGDACQSNHAIRKHIHPKKRVMVIEDSSHTFENTLNVLRTFSDLVQSGDYFIIEDSICHHGLDAGPNPGPYKAIEAFLNQNTDFEMDRRRESFLITWNPKGYLRRK